MNYKDIKRLSSVSPFVDYVFFAPDVSVDDGLDVSSLDLQYVVVDLSPFYEEVKREWGQDPELESLVASFTEASFVAFPEGYGDFVFASLPISKSVSSVVLKLSKFSFNVFHFFVRFGEESKSMINRFSLASRGGSSSVFEPILSIYDPMFDFLKSRLSSFGNKEKSELVIPQGASFSLRLDNIAKFAEIYVNNAWDDYVDILSSKGLKDKVVYPYVFDITEDQIEQNQDLISGYFKLLQKFFSEDDRAKELAGSVDRIIGSLDYIGFSIPRSWLELLGMETENREENIDVIGSFWLFPLTSREKDFKIFKLFIPYPVFRVDRKPDIYFSRSHIKGLLGFVFVSLYYVLGRRAARYLHSFTVKGAHEGSKIAPKIKEFYEKSGLESPLSTGDLASVFSFKEEIVKFRFAFSEDVEEAESSEPKVVIGESVEVPRELKRLARYPYLSCEVIYYPYLNEMLVNLRNDFGDSVRAKRVLVKDDEIYKFFSYWKRFISNHYEGGGVNIPLFPPPIVRSEICLKVDKQGRTLKIDKVHYSIGDRIHEFIFKPVYERLASRNLELSTYPGAPILLDIVSDVLFHSSDLSKKVLSELRPEISVEIRNILKRGTNVNKDSVSFDYKKIFSIENLSIPFASSKGLAVYIELQ